MTFKRRTTPVLLLLLFVLSAVAFSTAHGKDVDYRYVNQSKQDLGPIGKKIKTIQSPLSGAPSIVQSGQTLRIELSKNKIPNRPVQVWLEPSFGEARQKVPLTVLEVQNSRSSNLWPDKTVHVIRAEVPTLGDDFKEDLYDLHVKWKRAWGLVTVKDFEPRAVQVLQEIPENPTIATIADPQVGDPRALLAGLSESVNENSLEPLKFAWNELIGDNSPGERWGGFQKVIQEINAQDPDLILISGDLTFGANYDREFEDAYRLMNQFHAPTYITPGNHDGWDLFGTQNGQKRWEDYFAPLTYSRNIGEDLHVVSINTYDWASKHRNPLTWGGQVRNKQVEWLKKDLSDWRDKNPAGTLITFAHHDPTWEQSPTLVDAILNSQGIRDQRWSGDNRLGLRTLLNDEGVDVHFAGHTHVNRVARYLDDGSRYGKIVETHNASCFRKVTPQPGDLNDEYSLTNCANADPDSQSRLRNDLLDQSEGPLFIETSTVSSETGEYWGWRVFELTRKGGYWTFNSGVRSGGVLPVAMGYPMTGSQLEELEETQPIPDHFDGTVTQKIVDIGYYAAPSYLINVSKTVDEPSRISYEIRNNSLIDFSGDLIHPLETCGNVVVNGGAKRWTRTDTDLERTDVRVSYSVDAGQTKTVTTHSPAGTTNCSTNS